MYYGPGAGGDVTASAVISDLIDIARNGQNSPMLGFKRTLEGKTFTLMDSSEIVTKYYLRMKVLDKIGVLAKIAQVLGTHNISIDSFLQKADNSDKNLATLLFATHTCKEFDIQNAIIELGALDICEEKPTMIRIED